MKHESSIEKLREAYDELKKAEEEILKQIKHFELEDVEWYEEGLLQSFFYYLKERHVDLSIANRDELVLDFIVWKRDSNTDWGRTWCDITVCIFKSIFEERFGEMLDAKREAVRRSK